jgi:hypothetical protein
MSGDCIKDPAAKADGMCIGVPLVPVFVLRVTGAVVAPRGPLFGGRVYG